MSTTHLDFKRILWIKPHIPKIEGSVKIKSKPLRSFLAIRKRYAIMIPIFPGKGDKMIFVPAFADDEKFAPLAPKIVSSVSLLKKYTR